MKFSVLSRLILGFGLLAGTGCSYLEVSEITDEDRVLSGTVSFVPADPVPEGAILSVRIVDARDLAAGSVLLGSQRIPISGSPPFAFRTEYRADDYLMRRGVNVETRILVDGRMRYSNPSTHVVTLPHVGEDQEIVVAGTAP